MVSRLYSSIGLGVLDSDGFIHSKFDAYYFSFTTYFTIGYGDLRPVGELSKVMAMYEMGIGFCINMFFLPIILSNLFVRDEVIENTKKEIKVEQKCN